MAREFDSHDQRRSGDPFVLWGLIDCAKCGTTYDGAWVISDSITFEDMVETPEADMTCPNCGHVQHEEYQGWMNNSEAG